MKNANKPCYCGSGKKTKKCHPNEHKPRNTIVTYDFGENKTINRTIVSPTGEVKFYNNEEIIKAKSVKLEVGYERPKKIKILNQIPLTPPKYTLNPNIALLSFDLLLAIDTNTVIINKKKFSVTCLVKGFVKKTSVTPINNNLEQITLLLEIYDPINAIAFRNIKEKEENIGWIHFIKGVMRSSFYDKNMKIAIITDSDFGNIGSFNERTLPIYGDFYLPQNMELIHATRDGGSEYFANQLIRLADTEANKWIKETKDMFDSGFDDDYLSCQPIGDIPYTHWRHLA